MKSILALLACVAFVAANVVRQPHSRPSRNRVEEEWNSAIPQLSNPQIRERFFKDGIEYRYIYDSQILTGMPHIHYQFSGARIRAIVKIQLGQKDVMQIEKVFVGTLHERFVSDPRGLIELGAFEPITEQDAPFEEVLRKPVRFSYENGKIDDIEVLEDDPYWSINIKRAILSQFQLSIHPSEREEPTDETRRRILREGQLNFDASNQVSGRPSGPKSGADDSEYFTVMEDGIAGRCEVSYLLMKMPFDEDKLYPINDEQVESSLPYRTGKISRTARAVPSRGSADDNVLNVTKTFDYKNCEFRPFIFQGLHMTSVCPACDSEPETLFDLLESAAHTRYNITGTKESFIIDAAVSEAVYKVTPRSHYAGSMVAYANVTLVLIESGPVRGPVNFPEQSTVEIDGLHMIRPQFSERRGNQIWYESPEANKPMLQKLDYWPDTANKPQKVKALFEKLLHGMEAKEIETETADLVLYITRVLEYAFSAELEQIHQAVKSINVPGVQKEEIEHLFADLLVTTGTNCTFTYLKKLIETKQIEGPVVRDVLAILPFKINIDKVTPVLIEQWMELCRTEAIESDIFARRSCWLAYGTLVHKACAHNAFDDRVEWKKVVSQGIKSESDKRNRGPRQAGVRAGLRSSGKRDEDDEDNLRCPDELRQRIVQKTVEHLKSADSDEQKILVLKTLGNMGLNETIDEIAEVVNDEKTPLYIRTQAIWALKNVAGQEPYAITQVLLPIYRDTSIPTQIRIAAFVTLLTTKPELVVLQQVTQSLNREPDVHVASYVYSMLTSVVNTTDPCLKNLSRDALLALELAAPINADYRYSRSIHGGKYYKQMKRGLFWQTDMHMDTESPVPRAAKFRLHANVMVKSFDLIEFGYETEGLGDSLRKYIGNYTREAFDDVLSGRTPRHPRQAGQDVPIPELDQIPSLLNMQPPKPKELRGTAYLKLFGQNTRFLVINPQTISRLLVDTIIGTGQNVIPQLTSTGYPMDQRRASTLMDVRMELPTILGLPVRSGMQMPIVGVFKGKVKANMEPKMEGGLAGFKTTPQRLMVESDVKTTIAAEIHTKLNVYLAFAKIGTGVRTKMSFNAPVSGKMELNLKDKSTKMTMNMPENPSKLVKIESYPLTYVRLYSRKSESFRSDKLSIPQPSTRFTTSETGAVSSEESSEQSPRTHRPTGSSFPGEGLIHLNVTDIPTQMITKTGHVTFPMFNGLPIPSISMLEIPTPTFVKSRKTHLTIGHESLIAKLDIKAVCEYPDTEIPSVLMPIVGSKASMEVKMTPKQGGKKVVVHMFERSEMGEKSEKEILNKLKDKMPDMTIKELSSGSQPAPEKIGRLGHSLQVLVNTEGTDAPDAWTTRALLAVVYSTDGRFTKFIGGVNSKVSALPKKICLVGEMKMPDRNGMWFITPEQPLNKSIQTNLDISWGDECGTSDKLIKLRARIQKSKEQMLVEKEDLYDENGIPVPLSVAGEIKRQEGEGLFKSLYQECQEDRQRGAFYSRECVDFVTRYTDLLRVKFDIEYKNISRPIRSLLHKIERYMKYQYYWNVETMDVDVRNPQDRVSGLIDYSTDRSYVDIKYQTPYTNVSLLKLDLPIDVKPLSVFIPWTWPRIYGLASPIHCSLTGPKINTFDGISDDLPLSQCWHVLAKDKTEESLFAVLVAAAAKNSLAKKLALVFPGHRLEITPSGPVSHSSPSAPASIKNYRIKWDGQEVPAVQTADKWTTLPPNHPEDKLPLAWIHTEMPESTGNKEPIWSIVAPVTGLRVKFDGTSVTVMPSPLWKDSLVGLCGTYDGQPWDDKLLPNKTLVTLPQELSRAFLLNTGSCDAELPPVSNENTMKLSSRVL